MKGRRMNELQSVTVSAPCSDARACVLAVAAHSTFGRRVRARMRAVFHATRTRTLTMVSSSEKPTAT